MDPSTSTATSTSDAHVPEESGIRKRNVLSSMEELRTEELCTDKKETYSTGTSSVSFDELSTAAPSARRGAEAHLLLYLSRLCLALAFSLFLYSLILEPHQLDANQLWTAVCSLYQGSPFRRQLESLMKSEI